LHNLTLIYQRLQGGDKANPWKREPWCAPVRGREEPCASPLQGGRLTAHLGRCPVPPRSAGEEKGRLPMRVTPIASGLSLRRAWSRPKARPSKSQGVPPERCSYPLRMSWSSEGKNFWISAFRT